MFLQSNESDCIDIQWPHTPRVKDAKALKKQEKNLIRCITMFICECKEVCSNQNGKGKKNQHTMKTWKRNVRHSIVECLTSISL